MIKEETVQVLIEGFSDIVSCLHISNKNYLVAGTVDGAVSLWDLNKNKKTFERKVHGCRVNSVLIAENDRIISGASDGFIKITEKSGKMFEIEAHFSEVNCLSLGKTHFFSGSSDKTIKIWSLETNHSRISVLHGHKLAVLSIVTTKNKENLISSSCDGDIIVWNLGKLRSEFKFEGHSSYVNSIALNDVESHLFSAGAEGIIKVWHLPKRKFLYNFRGHEGQISSLGVIQNHLFSLGTDSKLRIWNLMTKIMEQAVEASNATTMVTGNQVFIAFEDYSLKVFDSPGMNIVKAIAGHSGPVRKAMKWKKGFVSAGKDGFIKGWQQGLLIFSKLAHNGGVWDVDIDETEVTLASVGNDFCVRLWKLDGFVLEKEIRIRTDLAFKVKILSNNRILLPFDDNSIRIFYLLTGVFSIFLRKNAKKPKEISFSKNHRYLLLRKEKHEFSVFKVPK